MWSATKKPVLSTLLVLGVCLGAQHVHAQRVSSASSGRISAVSASSGVDAAARGTGVQSAGVSSFAFSESTPRIAGGKVSGYGSKQGREVLGEYDSESQTSGLNFDSGKDFPVTDFVGTMPGPMFTGNTSIAVGGSNFGLTLDGGEVTGSNAFTQVNAHHGLGSPMPTPKMKDPDAILNPFTHPISVGLGKPIGTGLGLNN